MLRRRLLIHPISQWGLQLLARRGVASSGKGRAGGGNSNLVSQVKAAGDSLFMVVDALVDEKGLPRNPPKPTCLLLPSYQPASHPVLLGASSSMPTQCSAVGSITAQLKEASQQRGYYSPLWVSEAAASKYELQLRGLQSGVAVKTPFCGVRYVSLSTLRDTGLVEWMGDRRVLRAGVPAAQHLTLSSYCHRDPNRGRIIGVSRGGKSTPSLTAVSVPPHLVQAFGKGVEGIHAAMHKYRDSEQVLLASGGKGGISHKSWSRCVWISLSDVIALYHAWVESRLQADGGDLRGALGFGKVLDASVFLRTHVTVSGRACSIRLPPHLGVLYNSEQFSENSMLINLTKTVIMENLQSVALQRQAVAGGGDGRATIFPPNVMGRVTDHTSADTIQRMLAEARIPTGDLNVPLPSDDLTAVDNCEGAVGGGDQRSTAARAGAPTIGEDLLRLSEELQGARRRYERSHPFGPPSTVPSSADACVGDAVTDMDLASVRGITQWADGADDGAPACVSHRGLSLDSPLPDDSPEMLDIHACRDLTADDATDGEDRSMEGTASAVCGSSVFAHLQTLSHSCAGLSPAAVLAMNPSCNDDAFYDPAAAEDAAVNSRAMAMADQVVSPMGYLLGSSPMFFQNAHNYDCGEPGSAIAADELCNREGFEEEPSWGGQGALLEDATIRADMEVVRGSDADDILDSEAMRPADGADNQPIVPLRAPRLGMTAGSMLAAVNSKETVRRPKPATKEQPRDQPAIRVTARRTRRVSPSQ